MTRTPQMVRLSCKAQRDGRPCGDTLTLEAGLEDWAKDVMRKHVTKKHAGFMEVKNKDAEERQRFNDGISDLAKRFDLNKEAKHGEKETNGSTPATHEEGAAEAAGPAAQGKAP
jgi:hypothetical protein